MMNSNASGPRITDHFQKKRKRKFESETEEQTKLKIKPPLLSSNNEGGKPPPLSSLKVVKTTRKKKAKLNPVELKVRNDKSKLRSIQMWEINPIGEFNPISIRKKQTHQYLLGGGGATEKVQNLKTRFENVQGAKGSQPKKKIQTNLKTYFVSLSESGETKFLDKGGTVATKSAKLGCDKMKKITSYFHNVHKDHLMPAQNSLQHPTLAENVTIKPISVDLEAITD